MPCQTVTFVLVSVLVLNVVADTSSITLQTDVLVSNTICLNLISFEEIILFIYFLYKRKTIRINKEHEICI